MNDPIAPFAAGRGAWTLALAALAPPVVAQTASTVVHIDPVDEPNFVVQRPASTSLHPEGGVVSIFEASSGAQTLYALRRLDERGDRIWTAEFPALSSSNQWSFGHATVTPEGSTVFTLLEGTSTGTGERAYAVAFDSSGLHEWTTILATPSTDLTFFVSAIGSTPDGDVLVSGRMDSIYGLAAGRAVVRRLDRATGALVWSHESAATYIARSTSLGGRSFIAYRTPADTLVAESLDAQGNVLYGGPLALPFTSPPYVTFVEAGPGGQLAVAAVEESGGSSGRILLLDAAGSVSWAATLPPMWTASDATFTESGDLVIICELPGEIRLLRIDAAGHTAWQVAPAAETRSYLQVEAAADDGVVVLGFDDSLVWPFQDAKLEFIDANGLVTGVGRVGPPSVYYGAASRLATDARGNLWLALGRYHGSFGPPERGEINKVVPGADPSTITCPTAAPNSTGVPSRLRAAGSAAAADDNLSLVAERIPAQQFVLFLNSRDDGFTANPGGSQGDLCLGGSIGRYAGPGQIRRASAGGLASLQLDLPETPNGAVPVAITAGETWYFQAWHRDVVGGAQTSNLTNALSVTFL